MSWILPNGILLALCLHSSYWQRPHWGPLTNDYNDFASSDGKIWHVRDWVEGDVLIVGIKAKSICCGSYLTWGLFTLSESSQPLLEWEFRSHACSVPCLDAMSRSKEQMAWKKAWTAEKNPRHQLGASQGGIMVERSQCSHHRDPSLAQLWAFWALDLKQSLLQFFCLNDILTKGISCMWVSICEIA